VQSAASFEPLLDDYSTLDHASTVWDEHQQHLNELNEEIMRQQNTLHRMHMSERLLSSRHAQIKEEIGKLMAASAEVSRQLEELKGQYSVQINDLKAQYHDLAKALKKEKEAAQDELTKNIEEQNRLRDSIQEAMQKDAYYGTQARHAEEDVENYRTRAKDWEAEEKQNRIDVKTWEDVRFFCWLCVCARRGGLVRILQNTLFPP
jgi:chromosome segregation ATPase